MGKNVISNSKKTSLTGVYFHMELITLPLVSTCKVSIFDLKIFGQENLYSNDDIFKRFLAHVFNPLMNPSSGISSSSLARKQRLDLLRHLVSLFFVNAGDDDWINCRKI